MKIKVLINRKVEKDYFNKEGTQNENNSTILNFELPKEMLDYNKRIVFITEDGNLWDYIQDTEYKIPQSITKFGCVLCYIWLTKDDIDWRSATFDLNFYKNENADDMQPSKEELDGFNTLIDILNQKIEEVDLLVEKWDNLDVILTELSRYESMFKDMEKILDTKVDKVDGYGLSQEDFTSILKQKLDDLSIDLQQHSLKNVTYEANTGILNFIKNNEEIIQIDLPLELLIESGKYDEENKQIVLTLANLDVINIPLSDLIDDLYTKSEVDEFVAELKRENKYQAGIIDQFKNEFQTNTVEGSKIDINDSAELPANVTPLGNINQEVIEAEEGKTVEEKNITVEDVDINKEHSISVKGSISQEIREGYNLLNYNDLLSVAYNNAGIRVNNEGYIYSSIPTNDTRPFNYNNCNWHLALEAGTYTIILFYNTQPTNISARMSLIKKDEENDVFESITLADNEKLQFTLDEQTDLGIELKIFDGVARIMLIKGTEDKPYEKYGATPSIEYPSLVKYVTGEFESYNLINTFTQYEKNHTETINGIDYTFKEDGTIVANGISSAIATIQIINSNFEAYPKSSFTDGEYFLTGCPDNNSNYNLQFFDEYENTHYYDYGNGVVINRGSNIHPWNIAITIMPGFTANNLIFKPMLIKGTEHKPFLPYGTIKNTYKVKVQNKNLWIPEIDGISTYNCTVNLNNDEYIFQATNTNMYFGKAVVTKDTPYALRYGTLYDVRNTDYITIFITNELFDKNYVTLYDENKMSILDSLPVYRSNKFIVDVSNASYVTFRLGINDSVAGETYKTKIQLEYGDTLKDDYTLHEETVKNLDIPTGYELYGETDYYYKRLNKLYVHNEMKKVFLKDLTWRIADIPNNNKRYDVHLNDAKIPINTTTKSNMICNILPTKPANDTWNSIEGIAIQAYGYEGDSSLLIYINDLSTETDTTKFMELLQDTNAYLIYPLAEPTETEITDETFSQQLDDLYNAEIYEGVTNIDTSTEYEDMVELPNLNLHYNYVTPAPSPNRPSEYKYAEGKQTIVQSNKNLFDGELESGMFDSGLPKDDPSSLRSKNFIEVKANTNYAFSINGKLNKIVINFYDKDKVWIKSSNITGILNYTGIIKTPSNAKYLKFRCFVEDKSLFATGNIQIEMGDELTDYIPHQEQTYELDLPYKLAVIGDISDSYEITTSGDTYKTVKNIIYHKNFDEAILSELVWTFEKTSKSETRYNSRTLIGKIKQNTNASSLVGNAYSNILVEKTPNETYLGNEGFSVEATGRLNIYITDLKDETDTTKFMQLLTDTNAKLLYPLQNTEDIILTRSENQTFFEQLDKIVNDYFTYEGINHIIVQSEQGIPMKIKLEYKQSNKLILKSMQKEIEDLKNKIV